MSFLFYSNSVVSIFEYLIILQSVNQSIHLLAIYLIRKVRIDYSILTFLIECQEIQLRLARPVVILALLFFFKETLTELKQLLFVLLCEFVLVLHEELDQCVLFGLTALKHLG